MSEKRVKSFVGGLLLLAFLGTPSGYAQEKIISLRDGTLMKGKVLSKEGNIYRIETQVLGVVAVKESDVVMIQDPSSQAPAPTSQTEVYEKKILENSGTIATIQDLSQNKEVMDIFSDPELKSAILRKDYEYLKNNPKFLKFTQNPSVQKIVQDVTAQAQAREAGK
jgi:hypothetical protein